MFPASLTGNTFGDIKGGFLSNNKTRISIHVGSGSKRAHKARRRPSAAPCQESPQIPIISDRKDLTFLRSREYQSDLVAQDDYRIHLAKYLGKVVAVKVYQGENSAERLEADLELNRSLLHPTIFQTIAVFKASQTPFLVLGMESDSSQTIPISFGGFKSLACYLADALSHSETESLVAGAQLIRDISSGLDYLGSIEQTFAVSRLIFDLLVDQNNNICITVGLGDEDKTGTHEDGYLDVFHKLCLKTFLEANNECHLDHAQVLATVTESRYEPDLVFSQLEGDPVIKTSFESEYPSTEPRREYTFIPDPNRGSLSLRHISADYASFMRRITPSITKNIRRLRHKGHSNSTIVAHRCAGYRRDEVTLGSLVSRTAIIQHLTPLPREICPVCQELVEDGTFKCSCGQNDDGMSPTVQCSRCSVWSHRACQVDSDANRPLCADCIGSGGYNHAIRYLNKIKTRYFNNPDIYKQFLDILQGYQKELIGDNQLYSQVQQLFEDAPDLLAEFKAFLPDGDLNAV
ncbi:hypothetical protein C8J56DRAFT_1168807 [Mycena floridula]|nr:hypothetical protein C8J56DRAFT_1168807 [Mycena floridula]